MLGGISTCLNKVSEPQKYLQNDQKEDKLIKTGSGPVITTNSTSEVIKRPVIRSRVDGDDPLSAEKEAAAIRGIGKAGNKKIVRKEE